MFGLLFRVPVLDVIVANRVDATVRVHAFLEGYVFGPRETIEVS